MAEPRSFNIVVSPASDRAATRAAPLPETRRRHANRATRASMKPAARAPVDTPTPEAASSRGGESMADERDDAGDAAPVDVGRRNFFKGVGMAGAGAAVADLFLRSSGAENAEAQARLSETAGTVEVTLLVNG